VLLTELKNLQAVLVKMVNMILEMDNVHLVAINVRLVSLIQPLVLFVLRIEKITHQLVLAKMEP